MHFDLITRIGLLLLFVTILPLVFNAGTVLACSWTGVRLKEVAIFYGKPVFTIQTRVVPVAIGYIPLGGSVQLDMESFSHHPWWARCFVMAAGPIGVFLSSLICLGFTHTAASFTTAYPQSLETLSRVRKLSCFPVSRSSRKKIPRPRRNKRYRSFISILMVVEDTGRRSSALAASQRLVPGFFQSGDTLVILLELLLELGDLCIAKLLMPKHQR
jgi:hypothetical protein